MLEIKKTRDELLLYPKILLFYRNHPVLAVRDLLGIRLAPHQRLDLRLTWNSTAKDIIRLFGRGMSKTFGEALHAILTAMLYPRMKILMLGSGGFRQGKFIIEEVERIIKGELDGQEEKKFALKMMDTGNRKMTSSVIRKNPEMWTIPMKNGSVIATAPIGTKGDAIRGFRANITYVDERKDLKKEIKEKVIKPFSIIDYNVVTQAGDFENLNIDSGTLEYAEDDYTLEYEEYLRQMEKGDDRYLVVKFIYPDAFDIAQPDEEFKYSSEVFHQNLKFWKTPYGIKVDDIEAAANKLTTDYESWRSEHLCVAMRATGDYYSHELMNSVTNKQVLSDTWFTDEKNEEKAKSATQFLRPLLETNDPCVLGIDCAREDDFTTFTIIRIGQLAEQDWNPITQEGHTDFSNIIWAYQERNMHDPDAAIKIYEILDMFPNILLVAMDKRGGGSGVRDQLYHVVKDGKVNAEILFDPDDDGENGIATLVGDTSANDRLRLVTYTDEDNTRVNGSVRTAFKSGLLLFAGGDDTSTLEDSVADVQDFISIAARQFRMIKTRPTKNWIHFYTENPKKQKKDLYSSIIYGYGAVLKLLYDIELPGDSTDVATIAPTMNI